MRNSNALRGMALVMAALAIANSAWSQDRNAFRDQARQTAAQMRSVGEPADRCAFGGVVQQRQVIEVFGTSALRLGDRFLRFNGADVSAVPDEQIVALARSIAPGAQIQIAVERAGQIAELSVTCSNARSYMQPLLTALDHAARGRFRECADSLAVSDDSTSLTLRLQCASLTRRPEELGAGDIAYRLAARGIAMAHAIPERRSLAITLLRSSEAMINGSRGAAAFRELVDATRQWPGDENAWDQSEPDWGAFRRNAEVALRQRLIDPDSARFEWPNGFTLGSWTPFLGAAIDGYWTCGLINARNRMGGYTGSTAFVAVLDPNGQVRHVDLGQSREYDVLTTQCNNSVRLLPPAPSSLSEAGRSSQSETSPQSIAGELERLVRLRDSGALTEAEFGAAKDRLLGN